MNLLKRTRKLRTWAISLLMVVALLITNFYTGVSATAGKESNEVELAEVESGESGNEENVANVLSDEDYPEAVRISTTEAKSHVRRLTAKEKDLNTEQERQIVYDTTCRFLLPSELIVLQKTVGSFFISQKRSKTMILSDSPQQRALERMMTAVPRFLPQGGGTMVRHYFAYTAEMCDCRYCLYCCRKCTADSCPCIEERILAGAAGRSEVMSETMKDIHNAAFHRRLNQFIRESEELPMNFRNEKHRQVFDEAVRKRNKQNFALMAAIYLLTAEHKLWMQIKRFIERNEIKFDSFKPRDSTEDGYTLLCCTKDLYLGTKHITISDLADTELVEPKMFALICNASIDRKLKRKIDEKKQAHGLKQG